MDGVTVERCLLLPAPPNPLVFLLSAGHALHVCHAFKRRS